MFEFIKKLISNVQDKAKLKVMREALKSTVADVDMLEELLQHPIRKKEDILKTLSAIKDICTAALK